MLSSRRTWFPSALKILGIFIFVHFVLLWGTNEHRHGLFRENRAVEWMQIVALLISVFCFARAARVNRHVRVACTLLACMCGVFISRECDRLLSDQWEIPAGLVLLFALVYFWRNRRRFRSQFALYSNSRSAAIVFCSLILVLFFSRLMGHQKWWKDVLRDQVYEREVPRAAEESTELMGYLFLMAGASEALREAKLRKWKVTINKKAADRSIRG